MIYTITFNPALDVSGTVKELVPDEKSYVLQEIHTPGGNGLNAAIIACRLKSKVSAGGFLGGPNGEEIKTLLDHFKVPHNFYKISGRTRMNLTVSSLKTKKQTRLSFTGPKILAKELKGLDKKMNSYKSSDLIVIGGSLPPGVSSKYVGTLVRRLKRKGHFVMVDIPGKSLKDVIKAKPDFIKPNLVEFQDLVGKKVTKLKDILPLVKKLNKVIPLICVSSVEGGAILVSQNEAYYGRIPKVKIRSTVGAGDSMVGAMAALLDKNVKTSMKDLLRLGLASSCATLTEEGMVLGSVKSIQNYKSKIFLRSIYE